MGLSDYLYCPTCDQSADTCERTAACMAVQPPDCPQCEQRAKWVDDAGSWNIFCPHCDAVYGAYGPEEVGPAGSRR